MALERALRQATADATASIPLRPNRVHPLTRADHDNNVGIHAPEVTYAFEPGGDWIDITTVHKGGLFGTDYRMLFPADGVGGIKRFFVDTLVQFGKRGLACQPAIVGLGIGGSKDTCVRLGKEAACLRAVGSRNPDPAIAALEDELTALGNYIGIGAMGFAGTSLVVATHVEVAFSHTGGMPVGHAQLLSLLAPRHGAHPSRRPCRVPRRPDVVHRLLPARRDRVKRRIERLDDVRMDEVRLTTPVTDADLARLKLGDVVYLDGSALHGARGRVPSGRRRGRGPARRRARAHQRELSLLAGGQRAARRDVRGRGGHGHGELPLRQVDEPLVRALGRPRDRRQGRSHRARVSRVVRAPSAPSISPRSATAWAPRTGGASSASSTCTGSSSGIAQALWVLEVEKLGPFLVEGDRQGRSLFALANREINLRLDEVYRGLPPFSMGRFGETIARTDEVV